MSPYSQVAATVADHPSRDLAALRLRIAREQSRAERAETRAARYLADAQRLTVLMEQRDRPPTMGEHALDMGKAALGYAAGFVSAMIIAGMV